MSSSSPTLPPWLTPLNNPQHPHTIIVAAYEVVNNKKHHHHQTSRFNYSDTDPAINFHVHTQVVFSPYNDNNPKKIDFKGLSIKRRYPPMVYSDFVTSSSSNSSREKVTNLLKPLLSIPFAFDRVFFTEWNINDDKFYRNYTPTQDLEDMINRISGFVSCVKEEVHNRKKDALFLGLRIEKRVNIPDEEYEALINWYDEKKQSDSEFEKNYMKAISGTRRDEEKEILYETTLTFPGAQEHK